MIKLISQFSQYIIEAYSELSVKSKMELFVKIVNDFKLLIIFTKISITDVCLGSEYTSALKHYQISLDSSKLDINYNL